MGSIIAATSIGNFTSSLTSNLTGLGLLLTVIIAVVCVIGMIHSIEENKNAGIMGTILHWAIIWILASIAVNVLLAAVGIG